MLPQSPDATGNSTAGTTQVSAWGIHGPRGVTQDAQGLPWYFLCVYTYCAHHHCGTLTLSQPLNLTLLLQSSQGSSRWLTSVPIRLGEDANGARFPWGRGLGGWGEA